jgi:hypothetical protein
MPEAFLAQVRHSLKRFVPPLTPTHPAYSSPIPRELAQNCSLLALVADVDTSNAHLNIVLQDLDKLDADPLAFADTNPHLRYKFLLRSVQMELERLSDSFDQFLRLFTATSKLTELELSKLQTTFGDRVRSLIAAAAAEQLITPRGHEHGSDLDTLLRGIAYMQARIDTAPPGPTTTTDWAKSMHSRMRARRQSVFDAGMRGVTFWSGAIELFISQLDAGSTQRHEGPGARHSAGTRE